MNAPGALLVPRLLGALSLRPGTFAEVSRDPGAGVQAGIIVVVSGILEAAVSAAAHQLPSIESGDVWYCVLAAFIGWLIWSGILYAVGVRAFGHSSEFPPILRVVAFAHAPVLVYGLAAIPGVHLWAGLLFFLSLLWFAAALVAAVEGALAVPTRRALLITIVSLVSHEVLHQGLRLFGLMG